MDESYAESDFDYIAGQHSAVWDRIPAESNVTHAVIVQPKVHGVYNMSYAKLTYTADAEGTTVVSVCVCVCVLCDGIRMYILWTLAYPMTSVPHKCVRLTRCWRNWVNCVQFSDRESQQSVKYMRFPDIPGVDESDVTVVWTVLLYFLYKVTPFSGKWYLLERLHNLRNMSEGELWHWVQFR